MPWWAETRTFGHSDLCSIDVSASHVQVEVDRRWNKNKAWIYSCCNTNFTFSLKWEQNKEAHSLSLHCFCQSGQSVRQRIRALDLSPTPAGRATGNGTNQNRLENGNKLKWLRQRKQKCPQWWLMVGSLWISLCQPTIWTMVLHIWHFTSHNVSWSLLFFLFAMIHKQKSGYPNQPWIKGQLQQKHYIATLYIPKHMSVSNNTVAAQCSLYTEALNTQGLSISLSFCQLIYM